MTNLEGRSGAGPSGGDGPDRTAAPGHAFEAGPPSFELDPRRILETARRLGQRVAERFPGSGLSKLAAELHRVAGHSVGRLEWVSRPNVPIRVGVALLILLVLAILSGLFVTAEMRTGIKNLTDILQALESGLNDLVFIGIGVVFLVTLESRIKRRRALRLLRELRALAHIVDMHQLTKDPERLMREGPDTPSSPKPVLSSFELGRYLDYCSEMLALISKIAALYAQTLDDPIVLAAVDEVEALTTGLQQKIWHKIVLLDRPVSPLPAG